MPDASMRKEEDDESLRRRMEMAGTLDFTWEEVQRLNAEHRQEMYQQRTEMGGQNFADNFD